MIGRLRETKNAGGNKKQQHITMYMSSDTSDPLYSGFHACIQFYFFKINVWKVGCQSG